MEEEKKSGSLSYISKEDSDALKLKLIESQLKNLKISDSSIAFQKILDEIEAKKRKLLEELDEKEKKIETKIKAKEEPLVLVTVDNDEYGWEDLWSKIKEKKSKEDI